MNKNVIGVVVAVVAVLGIVGVVLVNKPNNDSGSPTSGSTGSDMRGMDTGSNPLGNSNESQAEQDLTGQSEVTMDIQNFSFGKSNIKVSKGTKVTWTNRDDARHNAFSEDDGDPQGELLAQGESYSFTFDTAGTFNYLCQPHPYMKGMVNVVEQ